MREQTWQTLRWTLVVALALLLMPLSLGSLRWTRVLENSAHAPLFALLTLLLLRPRLSPLRAAVLAALFGMLTEVAQSFVGRDASLIDLANDVLGIAIGLTVHAQRTARRAPLPILLAALLMIAAAPLLWTVAAYAQRQLQAPVLWQQRSPLDGYFLEVTGARATPTAAANCLANRRGQALRVDLQSGQYPGIALEEPLPDWRGHEQLIVELVNLSAATMRMVLRVHDAHHTFEYRDRFNQSFDAPPGRLILHSVTLHDIEQAPSRRLLELSRVASLMIFSNGIPMNSAAFCLFSIRLQ